MEHKSAVKASFGDFLELILWELTFSRTKIFMNIRDIIISYSLTNAYFHELISLKNKLLSAGGDFLHL